MERQLRLVGLDLLSLSSLPESMEPEFDGGDSEGNEYDLVESASQVLASAAFLEVASLQGGDTFQTSVAGRVLTLPDCRCFLMTRIHRYRRI